MRISVRFTRPILIVVALFVLALGWVGCALGTPTLSGIVRDASSGAPIGQATVATGEQQVASDAEGQFRLTLAEGSQTVRVSAPGYLTQELDITAENSGARLEQDISLERRALEGLVSNGGQPLMGAQVLLGESSASTDAEGHFQLDAIVLGPLVVSGVGYLPVELSQEQVEALFDADGSQVQTLSVTLDPRTLSGVVTEAEGGQPVAGAQVTVGEQTAVTAADGRYELERVEPGTTITVESPDYRPVQGLAYTGQATQDAVLKPWQVTLTVVDAVDQHPLSGVAITTTEGLATTDGNGQITLPLTPSTTFRASLFGYRPETVTYAGEETLQLALNPAGVVGVLHDSITQQAIPNALVQVFVGQDEPVLLRSDDQGRFLYEGDLQVSQVTIKAPGYARTMVPVTRTGALDIALQPFEAQAIYIPFGLLTKPDRIEELLQLVDDTELNAVVVDVKGDWAWIAWPSQVPLAVEIDSYYEADIMDLNEFLQMCHDRGIYVIARIVVFKDNVLAQARPDLAVKRADGSVYTDLEGLQWVDPFRQEVREYNIGLAKEIADMGFDEVQFDYLRFPSDGSVKGLVYSQEAIFETRTAAMAEFCAQTYAVLSKTPAFFSADIFGLTVWVDPDRDMGIGQRVDDIAPSVDYLSPMLYPTTFGQGNLGYDNPGLYPYEIVYRSVVKACERTGIKIRPWLQAYSIFGIDYGPEVQLKQRRAAEDAGSSGWIFWNASGQYYTETFEPGAYDRYPAVLAASASKKDY